MSSWQYSQAWALRLFLFFVSLISINEMSVYHDEVEIEDFEYDPDTDIYHYPCPCGDRFEISKVNYHELLYFLKLLAN